MKGLSFRRNLEVIMGFLFIVCVFCYFMFVVGGMFDGMFYVWFFFNLSKIGLLISVVKRSFIDLD